MSYSSQTYELFLVRLKPDGSFDNTFNNASNALSGRPGRIVISTLDPSQQNVTVTQSQIQSDGKIIVTGRVGTGSSGKATIWRFNGDGETDPTFGLGGKRVFTPTELSGPSLIAASATDQNGDILLYGAENYTGAGLGQIAIIKLDRTGSLVTSYASQGFARPNLGAYSNPGYNLSISHDGSVTLVGWDQNSATILTRLKADGRDRSIVWNARRCKTEFRPVGIFPIDCNATRRQSCLGRNDRSCR